MSEVTLVLATGDMLGECPRWHPSTQTLHWLDIEGRRLHRYHPASSQHDVLPLTERVSALAFRQEAGYLFTTQARIVHADQTGHIQAVVAQLDLPHDSRFNDGAVDPHGRLWVGTVNSEHRADNGLYCLHAGNRLMAADTGIVASNGIAWSPDGTRLYFVDSRARTIYVYDYQATTGQITNRRVFAQTEAEPGVPDGIAVDVDGHLVCAFWDGWQLIRYDASGQIVERFDMPVARPTACAYGGPDLKTLYITSARHGLSAKALSSQPNAGSLFSRTMPTPGLPITLLSNI